ncbi:helix-turn-helix transcriptional regulator [Enterobacter asburiae]|uniref:helix-turn-helix transcriptional regulator n=1 Tax=Enterobacter asburiae TaxID=61645 RepID=UPI00301C3B99
MKKMAVVDKKGLEYIPNIDRMIREKECRELTTLANSTRWKLEKEGKFPKRIKIGATAVAYRLSEIQAWIRGDWENS